MRIEQRYMVGFDWPPTKDEIVFVQQQVEALYGAIAPAEPFETVSPTLIEDLVSDTFGDNGSTFVPLTVDDGGHSSWGLSVEYRLDADEYGVVVCKFYIGEVHHDASES